MGLIAENDGIIENLKEDGERATPETVLALAVRNEGGKKMAAEIMNKGKVLKMLELFPEIDGEISTRRNIISDLEQYYNPIQGVGYGDTTKGKYSNSNQTERIAMNIPEYVRGDIQRYKSEIEELQKVKVEILKEVARLTMKQKNVIFGYYFNKMKWEQVAEWTHYSERQCKNIRDGAVERLLKGFENNRILSRYEIKE